MGKFLSGAKARLISYGGASSAAFCFQFRYATGEPLLRSKGGTHEHAL